MRHHTRNAMLFLISMAITMMIATTINEVFK